MSDLLENELVRKYFSCDTESPHGHCDLDDIKYTCKADLALRVLAAMQAPIKKGERYLFLAFSQWIENDAGEYAGFHPKELRLPDKFQPKEEHDICRRCGEPLDRAGVKEYAWDKNGGAHSCIHILKPAPKVCPHGIQLGCCLLCSSKGPNPQKHDPVEEKIKRIGDFYVSQGSYIDIYEELRSLVELVRTRGPAMTDDELRALAPQAVNEAVARKLFKDHPDPDSLHIPAYSTDIAAANEILSRWNGDWKLERRNNYFQHTFYRPSEEYSALAEFSPRAICLAFLKLP